MDNYDNHTAVLKELEKAQDVEKDVRVKVREVWTFLNDPDGQWEQKVVTNLKNRPRFTFDKCNDLVDDVAGEMEQAEFAISVKPAGSDATKDLAKTYDGMIRNIENISNADDIYSANGRTMIGGGFGGWRVNQRYGDNNSFDQDLFIDDIPDFVDRVWFDYSSVLQTREDAQWCFVLQSVSREAYKKQFPTGTMKGIGDNSENTKDNAPDVIVIGEFLYRAKVKRTVFELTNGAVYIDDEKFQAVRDEFAAQGVTVKRERVREMDEIKTRILDGDGWLTPVQDTVFDHIPIIPTYGNWSMSKNIPSYWGLITKKMDAQRVYNYSESRKVEEGALAPLDKTVATAEQVGAHKEEWENLNISSDPVLLYEHQDGQPPPYKIGGPQVNASLEVTSQNAERNLMSSSGLDQLQGQSLGLQSGLAVELRQNKGDTRNYKYSLSQERAICHTAKILVAAIPKIYDTERQVRIIGEDKSESMVFVNERMIDEDTGKVVMMNDLSKGLYDTTCTIGPAFQNRQSETVEAFAEIAAIDPSIIEIGKDVWYGNMNAPGFDLVAERVRKQKVMAGEIPEEQMTEEEIEFLQDQPEPEPDPVAVALLEETQNAADEVQIKAIDAARKDRETDAKIAAMDMQTAFTQMETVTKELSSQITGLKELIEAGASPALIAGQAAVVVDSQAEQT